VNDPVDLYPVQCNRLGGDVITVQGTNFGASSATVLVSGNVREYFVCMFMCFYVFGTDIVVCMKAIRTSECVCMCVCKCVCVFVCPCVRETEPRERVYVCVVGVS